MLIDWFTVGAQAVNFLILVWLMRRFLYKPILQAIDEREKRIATGLADASAKKAEAQRERDEFERKNEEFDQQRAALLSKAQDEAKVERERLLGEARQAADAFSAKRQEALRSEARNLREAVGRRAQQEVFAIARKALTDLATTSLEERMGEVFIWRLFNQVAIRPAVWGEKTDQEALARTLAEDVPHVLDYLEGQLPAGGFLFGELSVADVAIACFFRNAAFARFRVDAARWPVTAGFVGRVLGLEAFTRLAPFEERCIRTPVARHRAVLAEMGAPLAPETYGTATPRRGLMQI